MQYADAHAVPVPLQRRREAIPGGEGKVVHVVLRDAVDHSRGRLLRGRALRAHRAECHPAREGDRRPVVAEVRVELAEQVELVAVPAGHFGSPLAGKLQHPDLGRRRELVAAHSVVQRQVERDLKAGRVKVFESANELLHDLRKR